MVKGSSSLFRNPTSFCYWSEHKEVGKDGFIIRNPTKIHSRSRARRMKEAKRKGRHVGYRSFNISRGLCYYLSIG
ncbi:hypothetical protein AgCh_000415 [Apium graveolens]